MADIQEILNSVCGKQDNSNLPKCSTTITTGIYVESVDNNKELAETNVIKPIVKIERHGEYIVCDLCYISAFDQDLREAYNIFELYGSNLNNVTFDQYKEGDRRVPYLVLALTAIQGIDNAVTLTTPIMWCLTSDKPGSTPNTIRVLFTVEDVMFYEGQLLDEADRIKEEMDNTRLRTDMSAAYYERKEEELRLKNEDN